MPVEEVNEKTKEELEKEQLDSFLAIKDFNEEVVYTTTVDELKEVLTEILLGGAYTKTFTLYGGLLELTFSTVNDKERNESYSLIRKFAKENEDASRMMADSYSSKTNIACQLLRVKIKDTVTNLRSIDISERILFLEQLEEDIIRTMSKYLIVFSTLSFKAFESDKVIKNF